MDSCHLVAEQRQESGLQNSSLPINLEALDPCRLESV